MTRGSNGGPARLRGLTSEEQQERRDRFRVHWAEGVTFNKACGVVVARWDPDGVELRIPYRADLTAHPGVFHGGVVSALIDTAGCGAVLAGHDFDRGSRATTIAISVQFFRADPGRDLVATARCTRRGRSTSQTSPFTPTPASPWPKVWSR